MINLPVIIRPEAESDIEDAYKWYEAQRKGLGESFLLCIEEALSRASRTPNVYSIVHKKIRRILIHRFPFGVFFIESDNKIFVLGRTPRAQKPRNLEKSHMTKPVNKDS